jgi:hypothetical protein
MVPSSSVPLTKYVVKFLAVSNSGAVTATLIFYISLYANIIGIRDWIETLVRIRLHGISYNILRIIIEIIYA